MVSYCDWELLRWLSGKEYICQCRRCGFNLWSGKTPGRKKWQPTPVFLPGKTPWTEALGRLQSTGSQRVRQELTPEQQQKLVVLICVSHCMMVLNVFTCYLLNISSLMRCLFTYFAHFKNLIVCFLIIGLWEFFIDSVSKFFYYICVLQIFSPSCDYSVSLTVL